MMSATSKMMKMGASLLLLSLSVSCQSQATQWEGGNGQSPSVATGAVYLDEVIPPCVPLEGFDQDPCTPGSIYPVATVSVSAVTPLILEERPSVSDIMLGKHRPSSKLYPSFLKHLVVRGTVQSRTTRCHDYYLKLANYMTNRISEGLIDVYCFADIRVNEYLVGEGPPTLTVGLHLEGTVFSDKEGYLDREETIENYGGEEIWIANLFDDPAGRTAQAYEGKELVLFLSLPFAITLEAFVVNSVFSIWFVQRGEDGTVRAVAEDAWLIREEEEKRAAADVPLADLERQIAAAAVNRDAVTGGRIGTDASLPLLVSDANDLRTHYEAIGAVYRTSDSPEDGSQHYTVLPPPVPGAEDSDQPPVTTGEEDDGPSDTVPIPGGEDQPGNGGGGTVP